MKFVCFETSATAPRYGLLTPDGILPVDDLLAGDTPQDRLLSLIDTFDALRPRLESLNASRLPVSEARLLPPVPWPGKMLVTTATCSPSTDAPLLATLKSPESVIGPQQTVRLPDVDPAAWHFIPHAMLGLVIRGPAKNVTARDWPSAVFGYTCVIDVMARGDTQFGRDFWLAKADTLGPVGPCILTLDELPDPSTIRVRSWQNGTPAQDFSISDASHSVAAQVEFATTVMTLHTGDIVACGTSPVGARPLAEGDTVEVEIEAIGRLGVNVAASVRSTA